MQTIELNDAEQGVIHTLDRNILLAKASILEQREKLEAAGRAVEDGEAAFRTALGSALKVCAHE